MDCRQPRSVAWDTARYRPTRMRPSPVPVSIRTAPASFFRASAVFIAVMALLVPPAASAYVPIGLADMEGGLTRTSTYFNGFDQVGSNGPSGSFLRQTSTRMSLLRALIRTSMTTATCGLRASGRTSCWKTGRTGPGTSRHPRIRPARPLSAPWPTARGTSTRNNIWSGRANHNRARYGIVATGGSFGTFDVFVDDAYVNTQTRRGSVIPAGNLTKNPSFEVDLPGWTGWQASLSRVHLG